MKKIIFLLATIIFFLLQYVLAVCENPEYEFQNVCTTNNCYNTKDVHTTSLNYKYMLKDSNIRDLGKFNVYIQDKLDSISKKYKDREIYLPKFCKGNICGDKYVSLEWLLSYSTSFNIASDYVYTECEYSYEDIPWYISKDSDLYASWVEIIDNQDCYDYDGGVYKGEYNISKSYKDGLDYFFQEYDYVMEELKGKSGDYNLSDIDSKIIEYRYDNNDKHILKLNNVCWNSSCSVTMQKEIKVSTYETIKVLDGTKALIPEIKPAYVDEDSILMNSNGFIAGERFGFRININETLPVSSCDLDYKYIIYYAYEGQEKKVFLEETFSLDRNGNLLDQDKAYIKPSLGYNRFLTVSVEEWVALNDAGRVYFFFEVVSPTGERDMTQLNYGAIEVYPSYPVKENSTFDLVGYDDDINYYENDTIVGRFYLNDKYGNKITDYDEGLIVSHDTGDAKFYKDGEFVDGPLKGVLTQGIPSDPYFDFKIRFEKEGFYKKKFSMKYPKRDENNDLTGEYEEIIFSILDQGQVGKFIIQSKGDTDGGDFDISCTNQPINLKIKCTGDNFSGCKSTSWVPISFNSESDNGKDGFLTTRDRAYNLKQYYYSINHIDKTAPTATYTNFPSGGTVKANSETLKIYLSDKHPGGCEAKIAYKLTINGLVKTGIIDGNETISLPGLMETSGKVKIDLVLQDVAGNKNILPTKELEVFPDDLNQENSSIKLVGSYDRNELYANNEGVYTYQLILRDKYGNPIYSDNRYTKEVNTLTQDCFGVQDCKTISSNVVEEGKGSDTLVVSGLGETDGTGVNEITIKSVAPGVFTERFKLEMQKWDDSYTDIPTIKQSIILEGMNNSFKKPYVGKISIEDYDDNKIVLETPQTILFDIDTVAGSSAINSPETLDFKGSLELVGEDVDSYSFLLSGYEDISFDEKKVISTINYTGDSVIGQVGLRSHPYISYIMDGISVKYWITESDAGDDQSWLSISEGGLGGVRIVGLYQGGGKLFTSGQEENNTDIVSVEYKNKIKKNAETLVRDMKNGDIQGGVYYLNSEYGGDYVNLSDLDLAGVETLIIEDMNLIIDQNINLEDENGYNYLLGIITLGNYYEDKSLANVFVTPEVQFINAAIYADGGFISVWNGRTDIYGYQDSNERTIALKYQLILKGGLISRNTIGGSIETDGIYLLPGGAEGDFEEAKMYDLNLVRRGNSVISSNEDLVNENNLGYQEPFIVVHDTRLQTSPPVGFREY